MDYKHILISTEENSAGLKVGVVKLNRQKQLNAINLELMQELVGALEDFDKNTDCGCMLITGDEKAFAAGVDIKEMADASAIDMYLRDQFSTWDRLKKIKKPLIAAVSGYALGGGCELTMACDMIVAAENSKFGQPEVNLAVIPGAGGTQRLTRAIGKARAMELILTGKMISAKELFDAGMITRVVSDDKYFEEALNLAKDIASKPNLAVQFAKECINKSFETPLQEGIEFERKSFYLIFSSEDKYEGMKAFVEKRKAEWKNK